jgi:hypothetical protein
MGGGASLHAGSGAVKAVMVVGKTCEVEGPKELGGGTLDTYFKGLKILSGVVKCMAARTPFILSHSMFHLKVPLQAYPPRI